VSGIKAVFIDRDGTLLELVPYLHRPEEVRLTSGAAQALRRLGDAGWLRVVVTNQSGVARGLFSIDEVEAVHTRMLELIRAEGGDVDAVEICPHHPDYTGVCSCRKPASGMLQCAADRFDIDLARSWIIGDRLDDLEAGLAVGARGILVMTGYGRDEAEKISSSAQTFPYLAACFEDACAILSRIEMQADSGGSSTTGGEESSG
jgi:D-glycero-D-manno-heptose 1,7-bisphosphate phosphatase